MRSNLEQKDIILIVRNGQVGVIMKTIVVRVTQGF